MLDQGEAILVGIGGNLSEGQRRNQVNANTELRATCQVTRDTPGEIQQVRYYRFA